MKTFCYTFLFITFSIFLPSYLQAQCNTGQEEIKVSVSLNGAWTSISWDLVETATGQQLMGVTRFPSNSFNQTFADSVCVDLPTVLTYTIRDSKGYGLCCQFGDGSHYLNIGSQRFLTGGPFLRPSESVTFQVPLPTTDACLRETSIMDTLATGLHWVTGRLMNTGTTPLTSFTLNWAVDQGPVHTQSYSGLNINSLEEMEWEHPLGWKVDQPGDYELKIWFSSVEGGLDAVQANDTLTVNAHVIAPARNVLVDVITNFYCGPCADAVPVLTDRIELSQSFAFGMVTHSSGWSGNDRLYQDNPVDLGKRYDFYGGNTHPWAYVDGHRLPGSGGATNVVTPRSLLKSAQIPAKFDIEKPVLSLQNGVLTATSSLTALTAVSSPNLAVHVAIIERHIDLGAPQPNGEWGSDWVLKAMLPTADGTAMASSWTVGQSMNVQESWTLNNVYKQENLGVLVFVQDMATKDVHQVNYRPIREPDTLLDNTAIDSWDQPIGIKVYPNPARHHLQVEVALEQVADVEVHLLGVDGKRVRSLSLAHATPGEHPFRVDLQGLSQGIYIAQIFVDGGIVRSEKVVVR